MHKWKVKLGAVAMAASLFCSAAPVSVLAEEVPAGGEGGNGQAWQVEQVKEQDPAPVPVTYYTVSYKVGDQVIRQDGYAEGSTLVVTDYVPDGGEGYEFVGWVEEALVNTEAEKVSKAGDTIIVDRNITLVPKFNKIERPPMQQPVTLSYIVGPDTVSSVNCFAGDTLVVQYYYGSLSKEYVFIGWEDLVTGAFYAEGQSIVVMQNMQLVAVFAPAAAPTQFLTELPKVTDYGAREVGDDPALKESKPAEEPTVEENGQPQEGGQGGAQDQPQEPNGEETNPK